MSTLQWNGRDVDVAAPSTATLLDVLRDELGDTTPKPGCREGRCGACTVLLDGRPVRSCLLFAVGADGAAITTVEGLAAADGTRHPVQQAFTECHALQCGFCTPGFLTTIAAALEDNPDPSEEEATEIISGNLCRCTGYQNIKAAVLRAAELKRVDR